MVVVALFIVTPVTATGLTVTVQAAVLPPSPVVTVIAADPTLTAVTIPACDTVATVSLPLLHVTFWFVALGGAIVAVRVSVPPTRMAVDVLFKVIPVTEIVMGLTDTVQAAILLPSSVLTVMVVDPALTAVTNPSSDTVATPVLPLLHVTFLFVALAGAIIAYRVSVLPSRIEVDVLSRVTPVTVTGFTLTVQEAVLPPLAVVTVIVAVPTPAAVTVPASDAVATYILLLLHITFWFVALAGVIAGVRVSVSPTRRVVDALFKETPVTAIPLGGSGVIGVVGILGVTGLLGAPPPPLSVGCEQVVKDIATSANMLAVSRVIPSVLVKCFIFLSLLFHSGMEFAGMAFISKNYTINLDIVNSQFDIILCNFYQ
jgi:hypothetical protein